MKIQTVNRKILLIGAVPYWNTVAGSLLKRGGIDVDILNSKDVLAVLKWIFTFKWRNYDLVYQVCGINSWLLSLLMGLLGKDFIIHWIGSDVMSFGGGKASRGWRKGITSMISYKRAVAHISDSEYLLDELKELKIDAPIVRLLPDIVEADPILLPEKFTVISYWDELTRDFYRADIIFALARDFPDIEFKILNASGDKKDSALNVKFLGFQSDMKTAYKNASVLIRIPEHDSLSTMVLEMLARGRYVIYNKRFTGCHYAHDFRFAKEALAEIIELNTINTEGADFVKENYSPSKEAEKLGKILKTLDQSDIMAR